MAEEEDTNFDYKFKIIMIGNSGVGKSSYLSMYFDDRFDSKYAATIGIDFRHKTFKRLENNIIVKHYIYIYIYIYIHQA